MKTKSRLIALLTDLGTKDYFVGAMKGAILSVNPEAKIFDITHEVPKYDALSAAFILLNAAKSFPKNTIFVVVVDPGVGTKRKCVLVRTKNGMFFVAPDNGVLTLICKEFGVDKIYEISNKKLMRPAISQTFHGRDMMAPVAAHLSLGIEPTEVGKELESVKLLEVHPPRASEKEILGHILHVDDFGNLVTNIDAATISKFSRIGDELLVEITGKKIRMKFTGTFGDVRSGRYLCYVGSSEMLEMAKNMGNLAKELKVKIGAEFRIIR